MNLPRLFLKWCREKFILPFQFGKMTIYVFLSLSLKLLIYIAYPLYKEYFLIFEYGRTWYAFGWLFYWIFYVTFYPFSVIVDWLFSIPDYGFWNASGAAVAMFIILGLPYVFTWLSMKQMSKVESLLTKNSP